MNLPATAQSRVCTTCKTIKELTDFAVDKRLSSGRMSRCKACDANRYRERDPKKARLNHVKHKYNLSPEKYEEMVQATPHCPICGSEEPLVVDHDHSTSEVRGLICNSCNLVLGWAKDNTEILENAIAYLNNEPLRKITI